MFSIYSWTFATIILKGTLYPLAIIPHPSSLSHQVDFYLYVSSVQFSSVAQSCPTLWDSMNGSMPGLPVHHQLPESIQTCVHCVGDAIQPSHTLSSPSPPTLNLSQHHGLFQRAHKFFKGTQDWSPLGWTGWISLQSKGPSRVSPPQQYKSITSSVLSFLYSPTLTSIHDQWENHSLD